jgi:hypothetical protein
MQRRLFLDCLTVRMKMLQCVQKFSGFQSRNFLDYHPLGFNIV